MGKQEFAQRLDDAVKMAESGQKAEAESLLRALVAEGARIPKATMALGVLCGERGDLAQRRVWFQEARRLEEATGEPPSLRLLLNLLVDSFEQGEPELAITYGEEALALDPEDAEAKIHVARVHCALGNELWLPLLREACENLMVRIETNPQDVRAWRLLAMGLHNLERLDEAIDAYTSALSLDPNHLPSLLGISRVLIARGKSDEAMPWLMNALAISPDDPTVLTLNGVALNMLSEINEAVPLLRKALKADPSHKEARLQLGACLYDQGLYAESAVVFEKGLESYPEDLALKSGMAAALRNMGNYVRALEVYREVLEKMPEDQMALNNLMFTYSITDHVSPEEALQTAQRFWERKGIHARAKDASAQLATPINAPLKVGILSADIGSHVVGRFLDPLLRHHDGSRCHLELISMKRLYQSRSEELISLADNFHSLEGLPLEKSREILKKQNYDLIVDTSGYTGGSGLHLLADRCAPVQAHYIGYHATTGLPTIDWFIGDGETAAPELQHQFSERLWRLSRTWLAYPRHYIFPEADSLVDTDRLVLGSFCQASKISDTTLLIWAEILRRIPGALLVLKSNGLQDNAVKDFLEEKLENYGVDIECIRFIPPVNEWSDHLDCYNILDIALDTTPWSSATTGFEALGMGVPLVALRGDRMASRMSSSLVKGLGRHQWVANSPEDAVNIVEELGQSVSELRANKKCFQKEAFGSVLWDEFGLCKILEDSFAKMCV